MAYTQRVAAPTTSAQPNRRLGTMVIDILTTTDHKLLGKMYLCVAFFFFLLGGLLALLIRAELAFPGIQFMQPETFNQAFTMHGTIMLLMFATPVFSGFANFVMPLQIGAPRRCFPRLNAFSFWIYVFGAIIVCSGFLSPQGAAGFGWFAYVPLSTATHSPGVGGSLWLAGLYLVGLSSILGAVNFTVTILTLRAPGHDHVPDVDLHLEHPGHLAADPDGLPGAGRRPAGPAVRPRPRDTRLRCRTRRTDPVATPVLVLRTPPRGVRVGVAILRHRDRDHPGVQPQAGLRLRGPGHRHPGHRWSVDGGVGPPHVRHRRGQSSVLLLHDLPDRRPHRGGEVLQLDRHDVARIDQDGHPR